MSIMIAESKKTAYGLYILLAVSLAHLLNDAMQSAVPALFPVFQANLNLSFVQIGWIAFALNVTASVLQPWVGYYTDKRPLPFLLPLGMIFSLIGMIGFGFAANWWMLLVSAMLVGIGSSVLHPESSRVAYLAAGKGKGLAQSIFQVGGNSGQAIAPLVISWLVIPYGQLGLLWFCLAAVMGIIVQSFVARWYAIQLESIARKKAAAKAQLLPANKRYIGFALSILILLLFSKFVYIASMTGYYAFFYMDKFHLSLQKAQFCLFILQSGGMIGTLLGGPLADHFGRKRMIWFSIAGTAPFSLLLPYANPMWSAVLCFCIGTILMSGFSVIIVYAQEMLPGKVGTISGLFFGLAFGMAGLGAVALGWLIDMTSLEVVIRISAWLPLLGVIAFLLPKDAR